MCHIYFYLAIQGEFTWYDIYTVCPRSSDPFYIVTYYIKWVTTFGHTVFTVSLLSLFVSLIDWLYFCTSALFMDSMFMFHRSSEMDMTSKTYCVSRK